MPLSRDSSQLDQHFDVIVIGGGITGVCTAREAAGRGLRTLLIDKGDFGHATSSATSKLIHGGLRYLETYQFGVVRESLVERRHLALAAPHLVSQRRFVMPAWSWSKPPAPLIGAGIGLYTALGFDRNRHMPDSMRIPLPRWIGRKRLLHDVPWLDRDGLRGGFVYYDTLNEHPERLLFAMLRSAADAGAVVRNYTQASGFLFDRPDGAATDPVTVTGVVMRDALTGEEFTASAATVVNAAGPWMDKVLAPIGRSMGVSVRRAKGSHVMTTPVAGVDNPRDTVFARARSGHHVIVSPWQGYSFIGPTDIATDDSADDVRTDASDVQLILDTVNDTIDSAYPQLAIDDIEAVAIGVRPLIVDESKSSYAASRRHELYDHSAIGVRNLWSIGGGKWTTSRATGVEVVTTLLRSDVLRDRTTNDYDSRRLGVHGAFAWAHDPAPFLDAATRGRHPEALAPEVMEHLARLYGTDYRSVVELVERDNSLGRRLSDRPERLDIAAQVVYAVTDELACTLADVLDRRLVLGTLGRVSEAEITAVAATMAPLVGWSDEETRAAVRRELDRRAAIEAYWRDGMRARGSSVDAQ
jgi:glycerol-3-phosphate dehydrogenase